MAHTSFADLLEDARAHGSLSAAALLLEVSETGRSAESIRERMRVSLKTMRDAIAEGRSGGTRSRSGLTGGDAARMAARGPGLVGEAFTAPLASALAIAEVNAAMGRIVAAPTGGASGVVPAVILSTADRLDADDERVIDALLTAAAIGGIIAARASLSGAAGGCQAEIGSGAAMAAAAATELAGGTPEQCGHAASLALQGLLGLVCDPVAGLVEVPCVVRNATGTAVALAAVEMALADVEFPIPFDEVVEAASSVGRSLPPSLRETARGGLAVTPTAARLTSALREDDTACSRRTKRR